LLGLPGALLQPARDYDPHALGQAERHVLGQVAPADDVEERRRLLPLLGRPVLPAAVDGDPQLGRRLTLPRVADLRLAGEVPGDRRCVGHLIPRFRRVPRSKGRDTAWGRLLAANLAGDVAAGETPLGLRLHPEAAQDERTEAVRALLL